MHYNTVQTQHRGNENTVKGYEKMDKATKNFPKNAHHDSYSSAQGWKYLGSDDFCDYYINHKQQLTSAVFGPESSDYHTEPWSFIDPATWPEGSEYLAKLRALCRPLYQA